MAEQTIKKAVEVPAQRWENEGGAPIHNEKQQRTDVEERIRSRAFAIYSSRTGRGEAGDAATDWARAEREVTAQAGASEAPSPAGFAPGRRDGASRNLH